MTAFAVTGDAFGVASLAELGIASGSVATSDRILIAHIAPNVDKSTEETTQDEKRVSDSNNARKIVIAHLREMQKTRTDIVFAEDISDLPAAILQTVQQYRKADTIQGMVRYGKDGMTVLNDAEIWLKTQDILDRIH